MKIALAQINTSVGDIEGNTKKIIYNIKKAKSLDVDIVAFPELAITGYPPLDLLYHDGFIQINQNSLDKIIENTENITAVVGFVHPNDLEGKLRVGYNSAALISNKALVGIQHKTLLPTYDVFDEARYFFPAKESKIFNLNGLNIGLQICEDLWDGDYDKKITKILREKGAELIFNINSSPFYKNKSAERQELLKKQAKENNIPIFYVNQVGAQDELVFDGNSLIVNKNGGFVAEGKKFEEDLIVLDLEDLDKEIKVSGYSDKDLFDALVLGVRDYFKKSGFKKAVLGLSGGIDSSLTAVIATEALGKENVVGVSMPSHYSSQHSKDDAKKLAENLGIKYSAIPIEFAFIGMKAILEREFSELKEDITEENLQARIRGNTLMALSNKFNYLVLSTGNKTELALGYCTLYGDMSGGLAVISDLSKQEVYNLSKLYNRIKNKEIIPKGSIEKIPSAELKEDQFDPFDYSRISPLVDEIVENKKGKKELLEAGYEEEEINDVLRKIKNAEYKRKQAPPGIKVTKKAFGIGRKMPIVNNFQY